MRDTYLKYWKKRVDYSFTNGRGIHRYYAIITAERDFINIEYHHLKKSLVSIICGKYFYDTIDIPGSPPKKHMKEFRNRIISEAKYQMKRVGDTWDDSLIPENIY